MLTQALSFVLITLGVLGLALQYRFLRLMRLRHPAVWESLGRPTMFSTAGLAMLSLPLVRFLWREEYRHENDDFARLASLVRTYNLVFLFAFITFAVLTFNRL